MRLHQQQDPDSPVEPRWTRAAGKQILDGLNNMSFQFPYEGAIAFACQISRSTNRRRTLSPTAPEPTDITLDLNASSPSAFHLFGQCYAVGGIRMPNAVLLVTEFCRTICCPEETRKDNRRGSPVCEEHPSLLPLSKALYIFAVSIAC